MALAAFSVSLPVAPVLALGTAGPTGWVVLAVAALAIAAGAAALVAVRRLRAAEAAAAEARQRSRWILDLLEHDRERVARALHDGPVQDLLARGIATPLADGDAQESLAAIIRELRAMSEGLRPPTLEAFGLAAAVTAHADRFEAEHGETDIRLDLDPVEVGPAVRLALFRVVQEGLANAVRHGPPRRVAVTLRGAEDHVTLTVVDDGPGFDASASVGTFAASGRYGLLAMGAYADAIGARLTLESAPGRTVVGVVAPLTAPARS